MTCVLYMLSAWGIGIITGACLVYSAARKDRR